MIAASCVCAAGAAAVVVGVWSLFGSGVGLVVAGVGAVAAGLLVDFDAILPAGKK